MTDTTSESGCQNQVTMTDLASYDVERDAIEAMARRKQHNEDVLREVLNRKLHDMQNSAEQAIDYCRKLIRENADISDELKEMECAGNGLALVAKLLKREAM